jgi:hypothetical protein
LAPQDWARKASQDAPYVFTEQGVAMLSSVVNSDRAVQVNIEIMRAFVRLLESVSKHKDLMIREADKPSQVGGLRN